MSHSITASTASHYDNLLWNQEERECRVDAVS